MIFFLFEITVLTIIAKMLKKTEKNNIIIFRISVKEQCETQCGRSDGRARIGAKPTATTAAVADYCVEEIVGEVGGRCQLKQERRVNGNRCDVPARLSRTTNRCDVD